MRGFPSMLSLFRNEFNKFSNTKSRMLDSVYHTTLSHFCRKNVTIMSLGMHCNYARHNVFQTSVKHLRDNCIQKFSFGEVYRRIYGRKLSFAATRERSRKT